MAQKRLKRTRSSLPGITDEEGELTFSGEFPHGQYDVQELFAPEGWVLQDTRYRVSITGEFANEEHEVIYRVETPIHNEIVHADVRISKTDLTGSESLPGALIEVRNRAEGEMVCCGYTGEDGTLPHSRRFRERTPFGKCGPLKAMRSAKRR